MKNISFVNLLLLLVFCLQNFRVKAENEKPFVIPALQEWKGGNGYWHSSHRLVVDVRYVPELHSVAKTFADDLKVMFGHEYKIVRGTSAKLGDIFLTLDTNRVGANPEKYSLDISSQILLKGMTSEAVFWGTRTILQIMDREPGKVPQGKIEDWPNYPKRGFMLDVGRKFVPITFLRDYVKIMSYYKMNYFQIHLNDNGFKKYFHNDWSQTPAGFRLESSTFPGLATEGAHYSKKEFIDLQLLAEQYKVIILPEIDVPAHSLALTRYEPEIASKEYGEDHLDLFNPKTYQFLDQLFAEYLSGDNPVFRGKEVHIGTDEYSNTDPKVVEKFRFFTDYYIKYVESFGKKAVVWGALTHAKGKHPVKSDNVLLDIWYNGYADPVEMADLGFDLLNVSCSQLYIVPLTALYYHDYLDIKWIYNSWEPHMFDEKVFDFKDKQVKGGMFAVWNDYIGNGITFKDIHHRAYPAIQTLGLKMWTGASDNLSFTLFDSLRHTLSEAPGVNIGAKVKSVNGEVLQVKKLRKNQKLPIEEIGYGYQVSFDFIAKSNGKGKILFKSPNAILYQGSLKSGKLAFWTDGYLNEFDYVFPVGEQVQVMIEGDHTSTSLYIDGKLRQTLGKKVLCRTGEEIMYYQSTLVFPLASTGDFSGKLFNLKVLLDK